MKKAFIFDLDGCLVDSETISLAAIADEMRDLGAEDALTDDFGRALLGLKMQRIAEWAEEQAGRPLGDFATRVDARVTERFPVDLRPIDGAHALLEHLASDDVSRAVATGSSVSRMKLALDVVDIRRFFEDAVVSADQVPNGKPAPDIFLHAADLVRRPAPECVVLEESPHGVAGARAAGMTAIGFVGGGHLEGRRDDHARTLLDAGCVTVVRKLRELEDLARAGDPLLSN